MRYSKILAMTLVAIALPLGAARAEVVEITGTHSKSDLMNICRSEGGKFSSEYGEHRCVKTCKKEGGGMGPCSVTCKSDGKCTGEVPGPKLGKTMDVHSVLGYEAGRTPYRETPTKPMKPGESPPPEHR